MSQTLYERLGDEKYVLKIASDLVDNHRHNNEIPTRFKERKMTVTQQKMR